MSLRRRLIAPVLIALGLVLVMAAAPAAQDDAVVVIGRTLEPATLSVESGARVTWENRDGERHRIRSRNGPLEFDSGNLEPGESYTTTFVVPGRYPYLDERNDEDRDYFGTIIVTGALDTGGPDRLSASVTIIDESFQPPTIEVAVGGTVEWANVDGDDQHTVTSSEGAFDSGILDAGTTFSQTFDEPGTYPYFCGIHPDMLGTVVVSGTVDETAIGVAASASPGLPDEPDEEPSGEPAAGGDQVAIAAFAFSPSTLQVPTGTTLTWTNDDPVGHTVSATDGGFDSSLLDAGADFEHTFDRPGTFAYFCAIHPSMTGTIIVTEPATG